MPIRKIDVATGISVVDIPEAGLRILCGAPADAVKHLMRRGVIVSVEQDGVTFETGPNAILLSDVALQGGDLCNLAEFPVLQMLYRQGMILPGHPNNKGTRPLLIGDRGQVAAQMEYIFRGNYGLASVEELTAAGVDKATAEDWMRIKLRFAFGRIRPTHELLDSCIVAEAPTEIRPGVAIRRREVNVFEISHGGATVTVNLNLPPHKSYETTYRLGYSNLRREYFGVVHSGEGDGWDIHRPSMGSVLMHQGRVYLIDAGPNIHTTLRALGIGVHEIEGIFHTHAHDDHFAGLTTLVRSDRRIKYYAIPPVRASVLRKLSALMDLPPENFDQFFDFCDLQLDVWNEIDGLEVRPLFSPHPVETSIFLFRALWAGGYRTYAHFADIVGLKVLNEMITDQPDAPGISRTLFDRVCADYRTHADIKKLDIGGGLIHGQAEDFRQDGSGKIILAHTAQDLTARQKEIGSGAPFGTVDVLIPARQDYLLRNAHDYLSSYFAQAPKHHIRALLNCEMVTFNPETILVHEGESAETVYLVLSGLVDMINASAGIYGQLTAGAMIGETRVLRDVPTTETFRAASFVNALAIPASLYRAFIASHGLADKMRALFEVRRTLRRTWLFGEHISHATLNRLAAAAQPVTAEALTGFETDDRLYLILSGTVVLLAGSTVVATLAPGEFFGESAVQLGKAPLWRPRAQVRTQLLALPGALLRDIPVARWKLFETHQHRTRLMAAQGGADGGLFPWHGGYAINVPEMDAHHQTLFDIANRALAALDGPAATAKADAAMTDLLAYARYHFAEEEKLLIEHRYPALDEHRRSHAALITEAEAMERRIAAGAKIEVEDFRAFFQDWIVEHILVEDRRFARHLRQ